MQCYPPITADNVADALQRINRAFDSMGAVQFSGWCWDEFGCPVFGSKRDNLKHVTDFVKRLAVTDTQCQF